MSGTFVVADKTSGPGRAGNMWHVSRARRDFSEGIDRLQSHEEIMANLSREAHVEPLHNIRNGSAQLGNRKWLSHTDAPAQREQTKQRFEGFVVLV
jgi:hypothetical protein